MDFVLKNTDCIFFYGFHGCWIEGAIFYFFFFESLDNSTQHIKKSELLLLAFLSYIFLKFDV